MPESVEHWKQDSATLGYLGLVHVVWCMFRFVPPSEARTQCSGWAQPHICLYIHVFLTQENMNTKVKKQQLNKAYMCTYIYRLGMSYLCTYVFRPAGRPPTICRDESWNWCRGCTSPLSPLCRFAYHLFAQQTGDRQNCLHQTIFLWTSSW